MGITLMVIYGIGFIVTAGICLTLSISRNIYQYALVGDF